MNLKYSIFSGMIAASFFFSCTAFAAAAKPNIVVILADDQGYADVSFNPHHPPEVSTPNIDRLAQSGVVLTQGYASGHVCSPTRAGIMTGRYQQRAGIYTAGQGDSGMPLEERWMPMHLKQGGYVCGAFGKWHLGTEMDYHPLKRGFDYFYGFMGRGAHDYYDYDSDLTVKFGGPVYRNLDVLKGEQGYLTTKLTEEAVSFIHREKDNPFFAYVAYNAVHAPMQASNEDIKRFNTGDKTRDILMAMLYHLDLGVGKIVQALDEAGVLENTLIIYLSDNGGAGATHANNAPLRGFKHQYHEGGIRLPFIVSWPGKLKASQAGKYGCVDLPPRISYTAFTAEETLAALDRMKNNPFTLTCSFDPPHPPMVVQRPYFGMYPPDSIPVPESIGDPMTESPYEKRATTDKQLLYQDEEQIRNMRSIYYGMVREVDDWIGEILKKLDDLDLTENTLLIFTSDHGEMLGDYGMHSKMIFYEGSVHVPLLMSFPGRIKPGSVVESPVSSMDVCPTILDYLDLPAPACDGISLRSFISGKPVEHDVVSYSTGNSTPNYMIRSGDLKLMIGENKKSTSVDALYDLKADPEEMRNLIVSPKASEKNREQAKRMKARLVHWMEHYEPQKADDVKERMIL